LLYLYPKKKRKIKTLDTPKVDFIYSQFNPSMKVFKVRFWAMNGATRNNMMDKWELWEKHKEKMTNYASLNEGTNVRGTWELWEQH
jgi:hypothetical protein